MLSIDVAGIHEVAECCSCVAGKTIWYDGNCWSPDPSLLQFSAFVDSKELADGILNAYLLLSL
jgi:hypothetical protein